MDYKEYTQEKLKKYVPEFNLNEFGNQEIPTIISFFSGFIIDKINDGDLVERAVKVIDDLCTKTDVDTLSLIDDMAITFYDHEVYYIIRNKLSASSQEQFDEIIEVWKRGNNR